jgi:hypothetical protein
VEVLVSPGVLQVEDARAVFGPEVLPDAAVGIVRDLDVVVLAERPDEDVEHVLVVRRDVGQTRPVG